MSLASSPRTLDPAPVLAGAQAILDARLWCVVEVCTDVPAQTWEPRLLVCRDDAEVVATAADDWFRQEPEHDVRLAGYTRDTLRRVDGAPAPLCHVADESLTLEHAAPGEGG